MSKQRTPCERCGEEVEWLIEGLCPRCHEAVTTPQQRTPSGWRDVVSFRVMISTHGMIAVTADQPKGLLVMDNSLAQALARVPDALRELQDAGADMPRLEGVNLP